MRTKKKKIRVFLSNDLNIAENDAWNREFWSGVSDDEKFRAAWEMVEIAWVLQGGMKSELRLKRTFGLFKPASR